MEILQPLAQPADIFAFSERKQKPQAIRWLMSCGEGGVDFFQLSCGWALKDRQEVGDLTYSIAKEYVEHRAYLGGAATSKQGTPYFAVHLDSTFENLRRILNHLGLPSRLTFKEDWRRIHFEKKANVTGLGTRTLKLQLISRMCTSLAPTTCNSCPRGSPILQPEELLHVPQFCVRCQLQSAILSVAYRASCLAFTDWAEESRQMCLGAASYGRKYFSTVFSRPLEEQTGNNSPAPPQHSVNNATLNPEILGMELATFFTGSGLALQRLEIPKRKFIGVDLDGILLISYRAVEPSLRPGPVFIIREGQFSLGGEHRPVVREVPFYVNLASTRQGTTLSNVGDNSTAALEPVNFYPRAKRSPSVEASLSRDAIHLNFIANLDDHTNVQVRVGDILNNLSFLRVTTRCCHSFDALLSVRTEPLSNTMGKETRWARDGSGNLWTIPCIPEPLSSNEDPLTEGATTLVYYFPVAGNPLAQWLSIANASDIANGPIAHMYILQRECCLACTVKQAKSWATASFVGPVWKFCIIPLEASTGN